MILLIDAFNVMYKFSEIEDCMHSGELEKARKLLIRRMQALESAWKKELEIHLFVDGKKTPGSPTEHEKAERIFLYYSMDLSADHQIKKFIREHPSPGNLKVITSDKDILHYAKKRRCETESSEQFVEWVDSVINGAQHQPAAAANEKPATSPGEVDFWLRMFKAKDKNRQ